MQTLRGTNLGWKSLFTKECKACWEYGMTIGGSSSRYSDCLIISWEYVLTILKSSEPGTLGKSFNSVRFYFLT